MNNFLFAHYFFLQQAGIQYHFHKSPNNKSQPQNYPPILFNDTDKDNDEKRKNTKTENTYHWQPKLATQAQTPLANQVQQTRTNITQTKFDQTKFGQTKFGQTNIAALKNNAIINKENSLNQLSSKIITATKEQLNNISNLKEFALYLKKYKELPLANYSQNPVLFSGSEKSKNLIILAPPDKEMDLAADIFSTTKGKLLLSLFNLNTNQELPQFLFYNILPWRTPGERKMNNQEKQISLIFVKKLISLGNFKRCYVFDKQAFNILSQIPNIQELFKQFILLPSLAEIDLTNSGKRNFTNAIEELLPKLYLQP